MDDFETFKSSRLKMDPSARRLSDDQWQQAFDAHIRAKQRVGSGATSGEATASKRRRRSGSSHSQSSRTSDAGDANSLRYTVRQQSSYRDVRLFIDVFAWTATGIVVLSSIASMLYYTSVPAALANLLGGVLQVLLILALRLLAQVVVDIPDLTLYRMIHESNRSGDPALDPEE